MGVEPLRVVVTILECCVTFSGVKLSIRSFVLLSRLYFVSSNWATFDFNRLVGSMDRASSQQLQMWFSEHFFAPKVAAQFVTAMVEQIWREKMSEKPHSIRLLR